MPPEVGEEEKSGAGGEDRDDRSRRWLGEERLGRVQSGRVLVVGLGALGNELVKNLALLGVRELVLVDFDQVAATNLNRCVFFRPEQAGRCSKVAAVREALAAQCPGVGVTAHEARIEEAPGEVWEVDVVALCVDDQLARYHANLQLFALERRPFVVNAAMGLDFFEVSVLHPGRTACLACAWTPEYHESLFRRRAKESCDRFFQAARVPFPSISVLSSLCGGVAAAEVIALLAGRDAIARGASWPEPAPSLGCAVRYELAGHRTSVGKVYKNPRCVEVFCRRRAGALP